MLVPVIALLVVGFDQHALPRLPDNFWPSLIFVGSESGVESDSEARRLRKLDDPANKTHQEEDELIRTAAVSSSLEACVMSSSPTQPTAALMDESA